jgi:hypothetical protein
VKFVGAISKIPLRYHTSLKQEGGGVKMVVNCANMDTGVASTVVLTVEGSGGTGVVGSADSWGSFLRDNLKLVVDAIML